MNQFKQGLIAFAAAGVVFWSAPSAQALEETCYQIAVTDTSWGKPPELLCVLPLAISPFGDPSAHRITLKYVTSVGPRIIALFDFSLLGRSSNPKLNQDLYGVANPLKSNFNGLAIRFAGRRDEKTGREAGIVTVGHSRFFYRR